VKNSKSSEKNKALLITLQERISQAVISGTLIVTTIDTSNSLDIVITNESDSNGDNIDEST
jgi:hypothetical protein